MSSTCSPPVDTQCQSRLNELQAALAPYRQALVTHPVYCEMNSLPRLRVFMQHHVFAVWDFMSLLKWLQAELTCVRVPWVPRRDGNTRRLINEIVVGEESDDDGAGGFTSHFEMYIEAMRECGADVAPALELIERLSVGADPRAALRNGTAIPSAAREFSEATFDLLDDGQPHSVAAAFALGREDLIPDMFRAIVDDVSKSLPGKLSRFHTYLERHIELDGDHHTPLALRMLASLCGNDDIRWQQATAAATTSLIARRKLWDGVVASFPR